MVLVVLRSVCGFLDELKVPYLPPLGPGLFGMVAHCCVVLLLLVGYIVEQAISGGTWCALQAAMLVDAGFISLS